MSSNFIKQLQDWHQAADHQKIVEAILEVPAAERDYQLIMLLARAYNNLDDYETACELLNSIKDEGQDDDLWHFRLGYAYYNMGLDAEAKQEFERVLALNPQDEDAQQLLADCNYSLESAEAEVPLDDPEQYLLTSLHELIFEENEIEGNCIVIPSWRMVITPHIESLTDDMAVLYFYLDCEDWDRQMFECSVSMGANAKNALETAERSFLFSVVDGLRTMMEGTTALDLKTSFAGNDHLWHVYKSDIVGMGDIPIGDDISEFWDLLQEDITKRLGNQKFVYVKIYGAKNGEEITSECRINDVVSKELSAKLAETISKWETEQFGSKKQFFFIQQQDATYDPYPYSEEDLLEITRQAIGIFAECQNEFYDHYLERLTAELGDTSLAEELHAFLPEMCAENAFPNIIYNELINIRQKEENYEVYKHQLASFYPIQKALQTCFNDDSFTDELYSAYVSLSSIYNVICKAKEDNKDLDGAILTISFGFSDDYLLR